MAIKIGHATIDENGKGYGGAAGDQTGKEVRTLNWYAGGWHTVLRPKRPALAEGSAAACEAACANENIGYDQKKADRNSLYEQARAVNFDLSKIDTPCECDCSSLLHVCAIAGGAALEYGSNAFTTRSMVAQLVASGEYEALTEEKYLTADTYLRRGDILIKTGHTVMALADGDAARTATVILPQLRKGSRNQSVVALQRILSTYGYKLGSRNPYDGKFQTMTDTAVRQYQKDNGLSVDGVVGEETWTKLLGGK